MATVDLVPLVDQGPGNSAYLSVLVGGPNSWAEATGRALAVGS